MQTSSRGFPDNNVSNHLKCGVTRNYPSMSLVTHAYPFGFFFLFHILFSFLLLSPSRSYRLGREWWFRNPYMSTAEHRYEIRNRPCRSEKVKTRYYYESKISFERGFSQNDFKLVKSMPIKQIKTSFTSL